MRGVHFGLGWAIVFSAHGAWAAGADPAAARAQLQQGYALKQQGKCDEAIPYFEESVRLDRQPKALLNLADCEEKLHRLAAAQSHLVETRDAARSLGLAPYEKAAQERLAALEKIIPKLRIRLARDAPPGSAVARDGVELSQVSLGTPLPIDPGKHTIVARSDALERSYDVTLVEGESKDLEVTPTGGRPIAVATKVAPAPAAGSSGAGTQGPPTSADAAAAPDAATAAGHDKSSGGLRIASYVTLGASAVALGIGGYFLYRRGSSANESDDLFAACDPRICTESERARINELDAQAKAAQTGANVAFAVGGIALAAGVSMLLIDMSRRPSASGVTIRPWIGAGGGLSGTF